MADDWTPPPGTEGYAHEFDGLGHLLTPEVRRGGHSDTDEAWTHRNVIADYLDDRHRGDEANLLRDNNQHVVVHEGRIRPGRWTLTPLVRAQDEYLNYVDDLHGDATEPGWDWDSEDRNYMEGQRHGVVSTRGWSGPGNFAVTHHVTAFPERLAAELGHWNNPGYYDLDDPETAEEHDRLLDAVRNAPVEEIDTDHPTERPQPDRLARLREAVSQLAKKADPAAAVLDAIRECAGGEEDGRGLDGLYVYYHPDGPKFWIDQMDWHDGRAGKVVIAAAKKAAGVREVTDSIPRRAGGDAAGLADGPAVIVMNEGPKPPGEGWVRLSKGGEVADKYARLREAVARLARDPNKPHKFGCVMLPVGGKAAGAIVVMAKEVADADLADDGREDDPHVTALYGLHANVPVEDVRKVLADFGPITLALGKVSAFLGAENGKDYDVLKVEVSSPELERLHEALKTLPHTLGHKTFKGHATIGYVAAGKGEWYVEQFNESHPDGLGECGATEAVYSTAAKERTTIPLGASKTDEPAKKSRSPLAEAARRLARDYDANEDEFGYESDAPAETPDLRPGEETPDGGHFEPEREPADLGEFIQNKFKGNYDQSGDWHFGTGFILPDGTPVQMGPPDNRYEDHRGAIPTGEAMARWGWPADIVKEYHEGTRTPALRELMRRSGAARVHSDGSSVYVHHASPLTGAQRRAIERHAMEHHSDDVTLEADGAGSVDTGWTRDIARAVAKSNAMLARGKPDRRMGRLAARVARLRQSGEPQRFAAYRAPAGGTVVRGVYYAGGKLIPDLQKFLPRIQRATAGRKPKPAPKAKFKPAPRAGTAGLIVSYGGPNPALAERVARLRRGGAPVRYADGMSDGPALLHAAFDRHTDETPHLVYADWADDNGMPAIASHIRGAVEAHWADESGDGAIDLNEMTPHHDLPPGGFAVSFGQSHNPRRPGHWVNAVTYHPGGDRKRLLYSAMFPSEAEARAHADRLVAEGHRPIGTLADLIDEGRAAAGEPPQSPPPGEVVRRPRRR